MGIMKEKSQGGTVMHIHPDHVAGGHTHDHDESQNQSQQSFGVFHSYFILSQIDCFSQFGLKDRAIYKLAFCQTIAISEFSFNSFSGKIHVPQLA